MGALAGIAALIGLAVLIELFRAKTRRALVEKWVRDQGWTLVSCRYRFNPFEPNWLVSYKVAVLDHTGHPLEGTAFATGFIRRKVWADW